MSARDLKAARDLKPGMTVETNRGVKTVQSSKPTGRGHVWRLAFTDATTIWLGLPSTEFRVLDA